MVAQRKEVEWESEQALPRRNKIRKTVQQRRQEKNLNNALRTRCMILFVITTVLAVFFILRSGMAASEAYQLNQRTGNRAGNGKCPAASGNSPFEIAGENSADCSAGARHDTAGQVFLFN